ncbi:MAG: cobalt transport protein CbiN [Candidatus Methanoplasma sp.]|jgi:cobalt/nickel transport protein|nr:cobalt transport protein CbiN [Candidatus Methanoplasma sp.]
MERKYWYALGFAAIFVMCAVTLAAVNADFGGSDDKGSEQIGDINPDYEPWYDGIFGSWELPGETESLLFALQAAIGALIIGYCIGRYSLKRKNND